MAASEKKLHFSEYKTVQSVSLYKKGTKQK
jgi:hypothetical protein